MASNDTDPDAAQTRVSLPLSGIALASALVSVAALSALVVVAAVRDSDALATVALALAILAFLVQIAVHMFDAAVTAQQRVRAEQLHTEMTTVVARIEALAIGIQDDLSGQQARAMDVLVDAASKVVAGEAGPPSSDEDESRQSSEDARRRLRDELRREILEDVWAQQDFNQYTHLMPTSSYSGGTVFPASAPVVGGASASGSASGRAAKRLEDSYREVTARGGPYYFDEREAIYKPGHPPPDDNPPPPTPMSGST